MRPRLKIEHHLNGPLPNAVNQRQPLNDLIITERQYLLCRGHRSVKSPCRYVLERLWFCKCDKLASLNRLSGVSIKSVGSGSFEPG